MLLDWAYAAAGAPWIDPAQLAADVVATGHALGQQAATDRAYRLQRSLPPEASRFVVGLAGMWYIPGRDDPGHGHAKHLHLASRKISSGVCRCSG